MEWKICLSDIDLGEEEVARVSEVLRSKWLSMGRVVAEFEERFADFLGVRHALAVVNGTAALHLASLAVGLGPGDECIVPALTFVATANAVLYTGARPVFAEIGGPHDLNVSVADVAARITPRTRAISVVHYGGYTVDMPGLVTLAGRHGLAVIEDAAHAPGAELDGRKLGTWGTVGCFSFFANKNLVTGEGGMVVTDDDAIADRLRRLRSHGMTTLTWDRHRGHAFSYDVTDLGYNYRASEVVAALGLAQLERLAANNRRRAALVAAYRRQLSDVEGLVVPFADHPGRSSYHLMPIVLPPAADRRAFMTALRERGIQTSIHYPPIHLFSYYRRRFGYAEGDLPRTEDVARREVTLPLHPLMDDGDVSAVCRAVCEQLKTSEVSETSEV